jgi:hypothetical protein
MKIIDSHFNDQSRLWISVPKIDYNPQNIYITLILTNLYAGRISNQCPNHCWSIECSSIVTIATLISVPPPHMEVWGQLPIYIDHIFRSVALGQDIFYKFFEYN